MAASEAEENEHLTVGADEPEASQSVAGREPTRSVRGFEAFFMDETDGQMDSMWSMQRRLLPIVGSVAAVLVVGGSVALASFTGGTSTAPARAAEDVQFERHGGYDCWKGFGGEPLGVPTEEVVSLSECQRSCQRQDGCVGFVFPSSSQRGLCVQHQGIDLTKCLRTPSVDVWTIGGVAINTNPTGSRPKAGPDAAVDGDGETAWRQRASRILTLPGYRCDQGASRSETHDKIENCQESCKRDKSCGGVSYCFSKRKCHLHRTLSIEECQLHADWDAWLKPAIEALEAERGSPGRLPGRLPQIISPPAPAPAPPHTTPAPPPPPTAPPTTTTEEPPEPWERPTTTTLDPRSSTTWMSSSEWDEYYQAYEADVGRAKDYGFYQLLGYDCWPDNASQPLIAFENPLSSAAECGRMCQMNFACAGFIYGHSVMNGTCWLRQDVSVPDCKRQPLQEAPEYDYFMKSSPSVLDLASFDQAPLNEFYMYRAAADHMLGKYPIGQVNMANMDGVMWYLMNEIVTNYTQGPRCPRRFGISKIHRFKVKTRATPAMARIDMNFGARFAYDQGMCTGRCFPGNMCTGNGDCLAQFDKYGFVVGCNTFASEYPFPVGANSAPSGVWYSLPLDGRCQGEPSGEKTCTWSYEYAGYITLEDLEKLAPGDDNCCNGRCSDFWHNQWDPLVMSWRVGAALWLFKSKYPSWTKNLLPPECDFDREKWYVEDPWPRQDPWR